MEVKSILQQDTTICFSCGIPPFYINEKGERVCDPLEKHHIFGGSLRNKSERYGLTVYLHGSRCHRNGPFAVHRDCESRVKLQAAAQKSAMDFYGWDINHWMKLFYKNHLEENDNV